MLSIFRTNQVFNSVLLIFYILILRVSVFIIPAELEPTAWGMWSEAIYDFTNSPQSLIAQITAIILLLIQGVLINAIIANHRISHEVNLFPGLFYVLICCSIPEFLYLSPLLLANTFLILATMELFGVYKIPSCADRIFNAGFWVGIASLFCFSYIIFILWGLIGLNIMRAFKIKERLMLLIGSIVPYMLASTYYFWFDQLGEFWQIQFVQNTGFLDFAGKPTWQIYLKVGSFGVLLLLILLANGSYGAKKLIQIQKKVDILFWALLLAGLTLLFQSNISLDYLQILALPFGVFLGLSFSDMRPQWAESLHFILLVLILAMQFQPLLI